MSLLCTVCGGTGLTPGQPPILQVLRGPLASGPIDAVGAPGFCPACRGSGEAHVLWDRQNDGQNLVWLSRATLDRARAVN